MILRRVLNLHGMGLFAGEIDFNLIEEQVPFAYAAESPTFMKTKCARP